MKIGDKLLPAWVQTELGESYKPEKDAKKVAAAVAFLEQVAIFIGYRPGADIAIVLKFLPMGEQPGANWLQARRAHPVALRHLKRTWQKAFARAEAWKSPLAGAALVALVAGAIEPPKDLPAVSGVEVGA